MKIGGIIVVVIAIPIFLIGSAVIVTTLMSDYDSSICRKAAQDERKFAEAKSLCRDVYSDCYRRSVSSLTRMEDCESAKSFMRWQLAFGIVPAIVGGFLFFLGIVLIFIGRKRA